VKPERIATLLLVAFVIGGVAFALAKGWQRLPGVAAPSASGARPQVEGRRAEGARAGAAQGRKVIAYYFHGTFRCASCRRVEALSRKAVGEGFPREIESGRVEFKTVNVDLPPNRHFIEDYRLASQSLVIVEMRHGRVVRWTSLDRVWTLLHDEGEFASYVRDGVAAFLRTP